MLAFGPLIGFVLLRCFRAEWKRGWSLSTFEPHQPTFALSHVKGQMDGVCTFWDDFIGSNAKVEFRQMASLYQPCSTDHRSEFEKILDN